MRISKQALAAALASGLCVAFFAHAQGGRDVLGSSVAAKFTPQDFDLMWAAITDMSVANKIGGVKSCDNAAAGNGANSPHGRPLKVQTLPLGINSRFT